VLGRGPGNAATPCQPLSAGLGKLPLFIGLGLFLHVRLSDSDSSKKMTLTYSHLLKKESRSPIHLNAFQTTQIQSISYKAVSVINIVITQLMTLNYLILLS
jgi:hypothetical protein